MSSREMSHMEPSVTIRRATRQDASALARLAALDEGPMPSGDALVAEVDGGLRAALPLSGGRPIADPFEPTAAIVSLLALRASQLDTGPDRGRGRGTDVPRPRPRLQARPAIARQP